MRVAEGVGGEAGEGAWAGVGLLAPRAFGRGAGRPPADDEGTAGGRAAGGGLGSRARGAWGREPARPPANDEVTAGALAAELLERARRDPEFAAELRAWFADAERVGGGNVENVISGDAQVQGPVVQ